MSEELNKTEEQIEEISDEEFFNFPTIVKKDETIVTEICLAKSVDKETGIAKPIVFRKKQVEDNINILEVVVSTLDENIEKSTSNEEKNKLLLKRYKNYSELERLKELIGSKYIVWKATWRKPGFKESIDIDSNSFSEDTFGEKVEFNMYNAYSAKIKALLISWDVKDCGKPVPIKDALNVDPDILKNFVGELDYKLNSYVLEVKK